MAVAVDNLVVVGNLAASVAEGNLVIVHTRLVVVGIQVVAVR